jgi:nitrogen-specific signal transduction histidine kinase
MNNMVVEKSLTLQTNINHSLIINLERDELSNIEVIGPRNGKIINNGVQILYEPNNDFSGDDNIIISSLVSGQKVKTNIAILVANTFKPRARIIKIIGQELISNDIIALVELIKNAYDADSTNIDVSLNNLLSNSGEIIIEDNGNGMSFEKIINVWLEPATPDKKSKTEHTFSPCFQRRYLGEKGIGRFAVHRLGDRIELITRAKKDCENKLLDYETRVVIDWMDFTEDKYLDEIPIKIEKEYSPKRFKNNSGTLIRITKIHPWKNKRTIKEAILKMRSLESPIKPQQVQLHKDEIINDPGISINLFSNDKDLDQEIKSIKSLSELLATAFYKFSAIIDDDGEIIYDYNFSRIDYPGLKRDEKSLTDNLKKYDNDWFEEHPITKFNSPGTFEINFYAWDLDTATLRVAGLADYYKNIIKPNAGIRIYRDNFRVWPYGEPDDDWLELDISRLNAPKERSVSRNQVVGIIHLSSLGNSKLQDQSNREGLIVNDQYDEFYHLVNSAISLFARERKKDKLNIDKVSRSKKLDDSVTESIAALIKKIENNNHSFLYLNDIKKVESIYKNKINDILERYMMAAAIGISYSIPIHEMKNRLNSIRYIIDDIEKNPLQQDKLLRQLHEYVKDTEDIVNAVTSIMSRQKSQKVNLYKVANNIKLLKESDLNKYNIDYEIRGDNKLCVRAVPGLLNSILLNLVDNSIYWLRVKLNEALEKKSSFKPRILIELIQENHTKGILKLSDNGSGFEDPFELLIEPYYSRKSDGLGLGLYLVSEIMIRFGGHIIGYNNNGAVIELTFNIE